MAQPFYIVPRPTVMGSILKWTFLIGLPIYIFGLFVTALIKVAVILAGLIVAYRIVGILLDLIYTHRSP